MSIVVLYTWQHDPYNVRTVITDTDRPTFIDWYDSPGAGAPTSPPPNEIIAAPVCSGFDRYFYLTQAISPYAYYTVEHNSTWCGYVKPTCDIFEKIFWYLPQTRFGVNNGSVNMFCVSSFGGIIYYLVQLTGGTLDINNTTGYFTGLAPGNYYIHAIDANNCEKLENFTIQPYTSAGTHEKYRLTFNSIDNAIIWECKFLNVTQNYDNTIYPLQIKGTDQPILYKKDNPNEDKTTWICSAQLIINLFYDGLTFTPKEFYSVPEQTWKIELYKNDVLEFQGWLLPDEIQDYYADPAYDIQLKATDGLPSLKGNIWGDGSGNQGYSSFQIQQYGLNKWCLLLKQCLDQLGYDYGKTILFSSLQFNGVLVDWFNIATWSDILYDSSGKATDTYSALNLLLGAFKLCIFQHKGNFVLVNWNDFYYINNGIVKTQYQNCFYRFNNGFLPGSISGIAVEEPVLQLIGFKGPFKPVNPPQNLNLDKAYNIEIDDSFNLLALLFENPSFEIGAIEGGVPIGMIKFAAGGHDVNAFCHYDPVVPGILGSGAYDGNWVMRITGDFFNGAIAPFIKIFPLINIDQTNKKLSISFQWKPSFSTSGALANNPIPCFVIIFFINGDMTQPYTWDFNNDTPQWTPLPAGGNYPQNYVKTLTMGDVQSWQNFQITTSPFPFSQVGTLEIRYYPSPLWNYGVHGNFITNGTGSQYIDIDVLNITQDDASATSILQTGETHLTTSVTYLPNANKKDIPGDLFTYPNNKRVAGNVFSLNDYLNGKVANLWNFQLTANDPKDRLPATIAKAIARNYQRAMYIFEGDVSANYLQYYGAFQLQNYPNVIFVPFSLELDLRACICHVIMVEIDDSTAQNIYSYYALYANGARQLG